MNLLPELKRYCKDVSNGKIVACQKHVWACERFLIDIKRQGTGDFPYIFKEYEAQRFIKWSRFFKHTKGVLAGQHIEIDILNKFIVSNIYGWYHKDTGYRRFSKMYYQVARKNMKSQLLSLIGSYEFMVFLDNEVSEVYCAATNKDQAKIVYNETRMILERCRDLDGKWREAYRQLEHKKTGSIMRALSKEDRKSGDGLNPQCGIIDEYHAHETSEVYDVIDSGMGARTQPLIAIITTAGFNLDSPCRRIEYDLAEKLLDPDNPYEHDNVFAMVCELETNTTGDTIEINGRNIAPGELIDDINDERAWIKANPVICSYPEGVTYLRKKLKEALAAPDKIRNFLTKHMNVWVNQKDFGYMNLEKWKACAVPREEMPDMSGESCFVGLDLSAKIDLTSVSFVFPNYDGDKYVIHSHSFIPEVRLQERITRDRMPFDVWERQGWLTCTQGEVVDYKAVMEYCIEIAQKNRWYIENFCVDPWGAIQLSNDLIEEGYEVVNVTQGIKTLSEPTKNFREEVYDRKVIHDGNPVLSWALGNAVVDNVDKNENIMLNKKKSTDRIDPAAATMNAWVRAMVAGATSSYNTRSMRGFDL